MSTLTLTQKEGPVLSTIARPKNAIPDKYLLRLDPEWHQMWSEHGKDVSGAHLVTVEEFEKCPAKYSFTYPTWAGMTRPLHVSSETEYSR
jgi:hypothetical protein